MDILVMTNYSMHYDILYSYFTENIYDHNSLRNSVGRERRVAGRATLVCLHSHKHQRFFLSLLQIDFLNASLRRLYLHFPYTIKTKKLT